MKEIVVFDLDGTLLSGDSTRTWLTDKLKSNIFRFIAALIVTPIALPLMKFKKYKSKGASLYLWIATYSLNEQELEYSFKISLRISMKLLSVHYIGLSKV